MKFLVYWRSTQVFSDCTSQHQPAYLVLQAAAEHLKLQRCCLRHPDKHCVQMNYSHPTQQPLPTTQGPAGTGLACDANWRPSMVTALTLTSRLQCNVLSTTQVAGQGDTVQVHQSASSSVVAHAGSSSRRCTQCCAMVKYGGAAAVRSGA